MADGTVSKLTSDQGSRTVFGLMAFAVLFSLIGNEIKVAQGQSKDQLSSGVTVAGRIIIGGFFATSILVLLSHAGDEGRQVATGLAAVTTLTATLVYGGPVWDSANKLFGSTPTTPLSTTTGQAVVSDASLATGVTSPKQLTTAATSPTGA